MNEQIQQIAERLAWITELHWRLRRKKANGLQPHD